MTKIENFTTELNYIRNSNIRSFAEKMIENVPDYFFTIPASSSGKYHPAYALGEGGLLRHTKAAVRIAIELFRMNDIFTDDEKDLIITSLILHDGWKNGTVGANYTVTEHPLVASFSIAKFGADYDDISEEYKQTIQNNISTHMGRWTNDFKTGRKVLESPNTEMQRFVHLCDYIASRKCLEFNFDVDVVRE